MEVRRVALLAGRRVMANQISPWRRPFSSAKEVLIGRQMNRDKKGRLHTTLYYVSDGPQQQFRSEEQGRNRKRSLQDAAEDTVQNMVRALLPRDYPKSVRHGYKNYIIYQMGASLASAANGVLSTQALLYAMGLGAGSIPLAAALNWVLKDGIGQVGGIVFASVVNDKFDANPKRWKMVSAISLDAACLLELLAPLAPSYFLAIASLANVGKNICYLSSSASRAAIHNSFAIRENLADITAKSGSQSIVTSILGTSLGIALSSTLGSSWTALVPVFASLSFVHLSCNYLSLGHVSLNTINMERFDIILEEFESTGRTPPPTHVSARERFFLSSDTYSNPALPSLFIGRPLSEAVDSPSQLANLADMYAQDSYLLNARGNPNDGTAQVDLLIQDDADMADILRAFLHAHLLRKGVVQAGWKARDIKPAPVMIGSSSSGQQQQVWLEDVLRSTYHKLYTPIITDIPASSSTTTTSSHHRGPVPAGGIQPKPGECLADFFVRQLAATGWMVDSVFLPHADNRLVLEGPQASSSSKSTTSPHPSPQ